jgi:ureidoacrylate peracid hydrolase
MPAYALEAAVQQRGVIERTEPLDARTCALLVVDMQNAFVAPGYPPSVAPAPGIVANINRLAGSLRDQSGTVVWLRMTLASNPTDWSALYGALLPSLREAVRESLRAGGAGYRLHEKMGVNTNYVVLDKTRFRLLSRARPLLLRRLRPA